MTAREFFEEADAARWRGTRDAVVSSWFTARYSRESTLPTLGEALDEVLGDPSTPETEDEETAKRARAWNRTLAVVGAQQERERKGAR